MDFLSQIPMALLGRPSTGIGDFAQGAIGGLATGDSGSLRPGILSSLGRLGMMAMSVRQSKDPMALLKVKNYFDQQDAIKNNAMADPMAAQMTPAEFEKVHGFIPPSKKIITGPDGTNLQPGDYTGGRAQTQERVNTAPIDPLQSLKMNTAAARNNAGMAEADPYQKRQIYENGFGSKEQTYENEAMMKDFMERHPEIDPRDTRMNYQTQQDGSIKLDLAPRERALMTKEDLESGAAHSGFDPKYFQENKRLAGFDFNGGPLYDFNIMNKPQERGQRISQTLPDPIRSAYWAKYHETGGDQEAAAAAAGEVAKGLRAPAKEGKLSYAQQLEKDGNFEFSPDAKLEVNTLSKAMYKPEDTIQKGIRETRGEPAPAEAMKARIQELVNEAKSAKGETGTASTDEAGFQKWYAAASEKTGLNPNPDDPQHHYDYRAAYKAGVKVPEKGGHWPSEFKASDHPNRYVDGQDTKTGKPVQPVTAEDLPKLKEVAVAQAKTMLAKNPAGAINNFAKVLLTHPALANLPATQKLEFAASVIRDAVKDSRKQLEYLDILAQKLGQ